MSDDRADVSATDSANPRPRADRDRAAGADRAEGDGAAEESRPRVSRVRRQQSAYTESQVIMTTVKVVAPFAFTYGLFVTFHGAGSPGGGFQGGAIVAAVVLMIAFAFGIDATRQWLENAVVVGLAVGGVLAFAGIGVAAMLAGGAFLEYVRLPVPHAEKWGMEGVEILGIAPIVGGVLVGLFFLLAAGFETAGVGASVGDAGDREEGGDR